MSSNPVWTAEILFSGEGSRTRADVLLTCGRETIRGWGAAQRNPEDMDVPFIGREIAAARALEDLVRTLLQRSEEDVATETGERMHIHS